MSHSSIDIVIDPSISIKNPQVSRSVPKEPAPAAVSILTRINASHFAICLSCGAQALLWSALNGRVNVTTGTIRNVFHTYVLPTVAHLLLWWFCLCALIVLSCAYILRCTFHFQLVKSEFLHHIGVNFLFIPWTSGLLLIQSMPFGHTKNLSSQIFPWIFVVPVVILDVKTYGQWFTTERRFLSVVANPTSLLSVMGNFASAWAAAATGWKESALCLFTLGLAHYLVVFITLYQRLSGAASYPAMLRPVLFLFVATPSTASLAWSSISGSFGIPCRLLFFLSLFHFTILICRPTLFKKSIKRYTVAWWAFSFPLTFLALASVEYAQQVKGVVASGLMLILSALSILVFLGIMTASVVNLDGLLQEK